MAFSRVRVLAVALAAAGCGGQAASVKQPVAAMESKTLAYEGEPIVCRTETPIGKMISHKVCWRVADLDYYRDEVRRVLGAPINRPAGGGGAERADASDKDGR